MGDPTSEIERRCTSGLPAGLSALALAGLILSSAAAQPAQVALGPADPIFFRLADPTQPRLGFRVAPPNDDGTDFGFCEGGFAKMSELNLIPADARQCPDGVPITPFSPRTWTALSERIAPGTAVVGIGAAGDTVEGEVLSVEQREGRLVATVAAEGRALEIDLEPERFAALEQTSGELVALAQDDFGSSFAMEALANTPAGLELEKANWLAVDPDMLSSEKLIGKPVFDFNNAAIGTIDAAQDGAPVAVIDTGGFLGLGSKRVAVGLEDLFVFTDPASDDLRAYVDASEENLETLPEFNAMQ